MADSTRVARTEGKIVMKNFKTGKQKKTGKPMKKRMKKPMKKRTVN